MMMGDRITRLQAHQRSVDRYERLLRSNLSATELRFVEQRLFEERHALATLQRALEDESDLAPTIC